MALERKALEGTFDHQDAYAYNQILHINADIRRRARRQCRRFFTSQVLFTDELATIYRRRKVWKHLEHKRMGLKVDLRTVRRLLHQLEIQDNAFDLSLTDIRNQLQNTERDWKEYKKQHWEKREAYELRIDRKRAQARGTTTESQTKQRKNAGSTRSIFRKIRTIMKPTDRMAISTVEFSNSEGTIVECLSRSDIEKACEEEGQRRFTQARHSLSPGISTGTLRL